ncbi:hypothetical protein H632_c2121p0 [Helicosporidium sp. ATCC 50920]|nr:hypothetical protein H632_c2121p0 [Helicosporidium sp. ATCC 50920]|eukprot:KDD73492.1 hypothetical protein H632_c2121p0 [Helicosporidium sp. ATCC 50920]
MLQISLDAGHPKFRAGTWFAGLVSRQGATQATLSLTAFDCLFGCSGHGACRPAGEGGGVGTCACDEGFAGRDCARQMAKMELRKAVQAAPAAFEYAFFDLPELPRGLLQGSGELAVNASFSTSPYGAVAKVHPLLLLRAGNGSDDLPSAREYDHKFVLDEPDAVHALSVCPSQLRKGPWRMAIYNPLPSAPMGYNVTVFANGRCLGDCNKHGTCSDEGLCVCDAGWAGGDCSVAQGGCLQGSRRAEARPEAHGTCWKECECDEAGKFSASKCAGFECDVAPEGELPFRLKGSESACVQDKCNRDEWVQTAAFVCLKPCECPPDGGPCAVAADCRERAELRAPSGGHWGFWMLLLGLLAGAGGLAARIHLRGVPDWLPIRVQPFSSYYAELSDSEL